MLHYIGGYYYCADINSDALNHIGDVWQALKEDRKIKNNEMTMETE